MSSQVVRCAGQRRACLQPYVARVPSLQPLLYNLQPHACSLQPHVRSLPAYPCSLQPGVPRCAGARRTNPQARRGRGRRWRRGGWGGRWRVCRLYLLWHYSLWHYLLWHYSLTATLATTSYLLPPTSYLLPPTSYFLPPTSYLLPPTSYLLPATSYLLLQALVKKQPGCVPAMALLAELKLEAR